MTSDKLAINRQNFARVRLQLKCAFYNTALSVWLYNKVIHNDFSEKTPLFGKCLFSTNQSLSRKFGILDWFKKELLNG